jgi:hypothetical protein
MPSPPRYFGCVVWKNANEILAIWAFTQSTPRMSLPLFRRTSLLPERNDLGVNAGAFAERVFQTRGAAVFCKQIVEGFVGEFLKRLHALGRKNLKLMPGLVVKLHALSDHDDQPSLDFSRRPENRRTAFWFKLLPRG